MDTKAAQSLALQNLKEVLKDGDTIQVVLRNVAKSGLSHRIDLYVFRDNAPRYLTYFCVTLGICGMSWRGKENYCGASIPGCGMDMGVAAVNALSYVTGLKLTPHWL